MNRLIVLKDETYLAKVGGGSVDIDTLEQLKPGALAILVDGKIYQGGTEIRDAKNVTFMVGTTPAVGQQYNTKSISGIPRRGVRDIRYTAYLEGSPQTMTIRQEGGIGADITNITVEEGDSAEITVENLSYNHNIATSSFSISVTKKKGEDNASFVQRVADALNGDGIPHHAAKPDFYVANYNIGTKQIDILANSEDVKLNVIARGVYSGYVAETGAIVYTRGAGADVAATERDYSGNEGNGGYVENSDVWFKQPIEADPAGAYCIFNLHYQAQHTFPQNTGNSAMIHVQIACVDGSDIIEVVDEALQELFGAAYDVTQGAETGDSGEDEVLVTVTSSRYIYDEVSLPEMISHLNSTYALDLSLGDDVATVVTALDNLEPLQEADVAEIFEGEDN